MRLLAIISLVGLVLLASHTMYNMYDSDEWSIVSIAILITSIAGYVAYVVITRFGKKVLQRIVHHWTLLGLLNLIGIAILTIDMYHGYVQLDIWDTLLQSNHFVDYFARNMVYAILFYAPVLTVLTCLAYTYQTSAFYEMWLRHKGWSARLWDDDSRLNQLEQVLHSSNNWLNKAEKEFVEKSLQKKNRGKGQSRLTIIILSVLLVVLTNLAITSRMVAEVKMGKKRGKNLLIITQEALPAQDRKAIFKKMDFSKAIVTQASPAIDFSYGKLDYLQMNKLDLRKVNFSYAKLSHSSFRQSNLNQAQFKQAILDRANFAQAQLQHANLSGATLQKASFRQANLQHANLKNADLRKAVLLGVKNLHTANIDSIKVSDKHWFLLQTKWETGLDASLYKLVPQFDQALYNALIKKGRRSFEAKETATFYYVVKK